MTGLQQQFLGVLFYYKTTQICVLLLMLRDNKALSSIRKFGASGSSVTKNKCIEISQILANKSNESRDTYLAGVHIWPIGLVASLRPGWLPGCGVGGSADTAETFSSSLLLRQAALGFRFRSVTEKWFLTSHTLTARGISAHLTAVVKVTMQLPSSDYFCACVTTPSV